MSVFELRVSRLERKWRTKTDDMFVSCFLLIGLAASAIFMDGRVQHAAGYERSARQLQTGQLRKGDELVGVTYVAARHARRAPAGRGGRP